MRHEVKVKGRMGQKASDDIVDCGLRIVDYPIRPICPIRPIGPISAIAIADCGFSRKERSAPTATHLFPPFSCIYMTNQRN